MNWIVLGTGSPLTASTSSSYTGPMNSGPTPVPTKWLGAVQRIVQNSIGGEKELDRNDGRWLTEEAASAAMKFFEFAADALPGEPFIYKSISGDLVSEFKTKYGMLTGVISGTQLMLYPVVQGKPQDEQRYDLFTADSGSLQAALRPITEILRTGKHGADLGS